MFESINKIEWDNLKEAEGTSSGVPNALRGLISEDPEIQKASYWKLDNHVVLQSDLYEAAYYVIPFLLEIIKAGGRSGRNYVYDLLYEIANGYAPDDSLCVHNGQELPLTDACRKAVSDGIDLYFSELGDKSSAGREKALELLISLGESEKTILPRLNALLALEEESEFRKLLEEGVSKLNDK